MENDSLIGQQLGAYLVQSDLGRGGMARVYKAYHPRLRREVAIKVILAQIADREGFQARFEREAQVVASLEHPNIVSVYDFASEGHLTYLVMQYVGGGTLRDHMRAKTPLEPLRATRYAIQMARALHHAHQRGIVHRDVKPQNMLVSSVDANTLLLSDFGIAKLYQSADDFAIASESLTRASNDSSLTNVNQLIGTADYMAPEQALGKPVDARTDVYALGVVLYQMLTGEVPFSSSNIQGLLFQHVYTPPPSLRQKNPRVPEILAQITAKALAKAPADRFQSAEAMAQALDLANSNATNPLASFTQSTLTYSPSGPISGPYPPPTSPTSQTQISNHAQNLTNDYVTRPTAQTEPGISRMTNPSGVPLPTTSSGLTNAPLPIPRARKRPLPLSYLLAALVLIACLIVVGVRFLPKTNGGSTGGSQQNNGQAQAFTDHFQNNTLGWQTGSLANSISATVPSGGLYSVTVPQNETAFPYPQKVGTLPGNFDLSATFQSPRPSGLGAFYGLVLHFGQNSSGVSGYAFIINTSGSYQIIKYKSTATTPAASAQGTYSAPGPYPHTLKVQARSSNYTFSVDGKAVTLATSSNPANTVWSDGDLQGGTISLFYAVSANAATTFTANLVQLSIP